MSQVVGAVLAEVADRIKDSNALVKNRVIDALVEDEVAARAATLNKALAKVVELTRGMKKLKPDIETVAGDGTPSFNWSKKAWEEKKKADETLERLEAAVEKALSDGEFGKLREVLAKSGGDKQGKPADTTATE